jgi:hypothetical protein
MTETLLLISGSQLGFRQLYPAEDIQSMWMLKTYRRSIPKTTFARPIHSKSPLGSGKAAFSPETCLSSGTIVDLQSIILRSGMLSDSVLAAYIISRSANLTSPILVFQITSSAISKSTSDTTRMQNALVLVTLWLLASSAS